MMAPSGECNLCEKYTHLISGNVMEKHWIGCTAVQIIVSELRYRGTVMFCVAYTDIRGRGR